MAGEPMTECTVSEIAAPIRNALVGGPFGSDLVSRDYVPSGIPVIRGTNMGQGRWVSGEFAYVTNEKADSLSANCAKPGDLVFTQRGTLGQVALVPKNGADRYLISQSQMKLTVDAEKADTLFLYYVFTSAEQQDYIRQNAIQTGVPHTNLGILRNTPLTLPPLPEQKAIAHILGTLDDKIELNRRMNATLEAMARALFQSWFVDFDPVRAKLDGRQPAGLDEATAALFPAHFQDSPLGPIPQGWTIRQLAEVIDVKHGYAFGSEYFRDEPTGDILLTPGNFAVGGGFKDGKVKFYDGPVPEDYVLREFDLLLTMTDLSKEADTLGYPALIPTPPQPRRYLHNQRLGKVVITNSDQANIPFLYRVYCSDAYRNEILASATGTTVKHTSPSRIRAFKTIFPPPSVISLFAQLTMPWIQQAAKNREQSRTLAALRDTLLPKLLSGALRVADIHELAHSSSGTDG